MEVENILLILLIISIGLLVVLYVINMNKIKYSGGSSKVHKTMDNNSTFIKELWHSDNKNDLLRLFSLLIYYGIPRKRIVKLLNQYSKKNMTDFKIMKNLKIISDKEMRKIKKNIVNKKNNITIASREQKRAKEILSVLKNNGITKQKGPYLDIGANDGKITSEVGKIIDLNKKDIHGVDIKQWVGSDNIIDENINKRINFKYINLSGDGKNIIPYRDNNFNFITILQALHHFENLYDMMGEISRVCKKGGIVLIREHNAEKISTHKLIDIEHLLYGIISDNLSIELYKNNYYGKYRTMNEWDDIFNNYGFSCLYKQHKNNPTKHYYALYIKN